MRGVLIVPILVVVVGLVVWIQTRNEAVAYCDRLATDVRSFSASGERSDFSRQQWLTAVPRYNQSGCR